MPASVARKEAKRERMLDAAVLEIARHGYFGTTVSSIARRAGVADGTIYLYFKSKEDVLVSIFQRAMQQFIGEAQRIVDDPVAGAEEKFRRTVTLHLSLLGENRDLAVIFQVEFRHTLHVLELLSRSHIRDYLALIARVVQQGKDEGVFQPDVDTLLAAKVVFGVLDEMATDWVLSRKN
ncbi:MAG: TetR family transcriptional regulator, partial [Gemmatimonadota bacterium]|nr:TetR family transcriptional regulator [Gemmatimonadota bacterium]